MFSQGKLKTLFSVCLLPKSVDLKDIYILNPILVVMLPFPSLPSFPYLPFCHVFYMFFQTTIYQLNQARSSQNFQENIDKVIQYAKDDPILQAFSNKPELLKA